MLSEFDLPILLHSFGTDEESQVLSGPDSVLCVNGKLLQLLESDVIVSLERGFVFVEILDWLWLTEMIKQ